MTTQPRLLAASCVLLLALNLRPVVSAVGAVVPELRVDTGLSASVIGLLLSLPMLVFATLGLTAPALAERVGPHRTVVIALALLTVGQLVRAAVPGIGPLFAGSLVALAGIAIANVVMPGLVRLHFAHRIPLMTAAYTTTLSIGAAASAALSNPIEHALGGTWRLGLGSWTALAGVALLPWLVLTRRAAGQPVAATGHRLPLRTVARTRLAWTLALYFGIQAMLAYVILGWLPEILTHRGLGATAAAYQVAVIIIVGIPPAAVASSVLSRTRRPEVLVVTLSGCYLAGFLGLVVVPLSAVVVCSILIGIGSAAFPVALSLIAMRSRSPLATTSLSAFTQSVGYLVAALGPFAFGALYERTGSWTPPLMGLAIGAVVQAACGILAVRAGTLDDALASS